MVVGACRIAHQPVFDVIVRLWTPRSILAHYRGTALSAKQLDLGPYAESKGMMAPPASSEGLRSNNGGRSRLRDMERRQRFRTTVGVLLLIWRRVGFSAPHDG